MAGTTSTGRSRSRAPIAGINITPLVDVMLVLLVIMMVSATYIVSQTLKVELPKTATSDGSAPSVATITVTADHELLLDGEVVTEEQLVQRLRSAFAGDPALTLVVSADQKADHGAVIHVLDLARVEGITKFAINVEHRPGATG